MCPGVGNNARCPPWASSVGPNQMAPALPSVRCYFVEDKNTITDATHSKVKGVWDGLDWILLLEVRTLVLLEHLVVLIKIMMTKAIIIMIMMMMMMMMMSRTCNVEADHEWG